MRPLTFFVILLLNLFFSLFLGTCYFGEEKGLPQAEIGILTEFTYMELEYSWEVMCEKFEDRCWCGHLRAYGECVLGTQPCPPPPVLHASCVHVLVCLCLLYLLVELIVMILIQGKDPSTNWILPIPLNWMIHFSLSQAMIAPKKKILICFAIHLLLLPLPIKRLTQAILLTSVL